MHKKKLNFSGLNTTNDEDSDEDWSKRDKELHLQFFTNSKLTVNVINPENITNVLKLLAYW